MFHARFKNVLLREKRMDLLRQIRDLLGQFRVLLGEVGVRLQELEELVGLGLGGSFDPSVVLVDPISVEFVAVGLACLREQNQRRRIRGLK